MKKKRFSDDIYLVDVYLLWNYKKDEPHEWCGRLTDYKYGLEPSNDSGISFHFEDKNGLDVHGVGIQEWKGDIWSVNTLAHELIHMTFGILEARGVKIDKENDEAIGYYHSYWFRTMLEILNKKK